jgi:glycosyltransferase involved in cell wall biosynthesis
VHIRQDSDARRSRGVSGTERQLLNRGATNESGRITVTICVCTRNRPDELRRALSSIQASTIPPCQVIVSDDGDDDRTMRVVRSFYPEVQYVVGPHQGLGPNRNAVVRPAVGSHVLFLDDDASLGPRFIETMGVHYRHLEVELQARAIMTGTEVRDDDERVFPHGVSFLGFQSRTYKPGEPLRTVVINATLFPRELFDVVDFDHRLVYGYDEVDLVTQAVAAGYVVVPCFDACNDHAPSPINRSEYRPYTDASRLFVVFKGRLLMGGTCWGSWCWFAVASAHVYLAALRRQGIPGVTRACFTVATACGYIWKYVRDLDRPYSIAQLRCALRRGKGSGGRRKSD